jgi:hypothetical protein
MQLVPVCVSESDRVISGHQTQPKRQLNIGPGIMKELGATTRRLNVVVEVQLHIFLTSALDRSELSAPKTSYFESREIALSMH